jgi:hypothetical protein
MKQVNEFFISFFYLPPSHFILSLLILVSSAFAAVERLTPFEPFPPFLPSHNPHRNSLLLFPAILSNSSAQNLKPHTQAWGINFSRRIYAAQLLVCSHTRLPR